MNKEILKDKIKYLIQERFNSSVTDDDIDIFLDGGNLIIRAEIDMDYEMWGEFKLIERNRVSNV